MYLYLHTYIYETVSGNASGFASQTACETACETASGRARPASDPRTRLSLVSQLTLCGATFLTPVSFFLLFQTTMDDPTDKKPEGHDDIPAQVNVIYIYLCVHVCVPSRALSLSFPSLYVCAGGWVRIYIHDKKPAGHDDIPTQLPVVYIFVSVCGCMCGCPPPSPRSLALFAFSLYIGVGG